MFYCSRVVVQAPCKINLSLDITGTDSAGYHTLETVMHAAGLCDVLVIGKRADTETRVTCSHPQAPQDEMNVAYLAAKAFFEATGAPRQGLSIHIDKAIPIEAGLAGGSADAAAVLLGLDRLFETNLSLTVLQKIGRKVGADVPFCLKGGCALAKGRGDILTELPPLEDCQIAIAKPPKGISTRLAFKLYDERGADSQRPDTAGIVEAIKGGDPAEIGSRMFSVFGALGHAEETELLSGIMLCAGALGSVLSGSGSAVVGLFGEEKAARACLNLLKEQTRESWLTVPVGHGAEILHVS
jgi:4-diphosphocytidyl-2-C-methyl-D-erythritol kinase